MSASSVRTSGSEVESNGSKPPSRRRVVAWDPGNDTLVAFCTLLGFWGCYWAGTTINEWFLLVGIVVMGTVIPALVVLLQRREGVAGLGIRRRFLLLSLIISAVLGVGSAYQLFSVATAQGVPVVPHLVANLMVLWEPLFVFGWLFLRWERAFGWLPAIFLTGVGFALQHIGSVPFEVVLSFGMFAVLFGVVFACVRNLAILWPLFYPVASGIGTMQAGFVMGWSEVASGAVLFAVQVVVLVVVTWIARHRPIQRSPGMFSA